MAGSGRRPAILPARITLRRRSVRVARCDQRCRDRVDRELRDAANRGSVRILYFASRFSLFRDREDCESGGRLCRTEGDGRRDRGAVAGTRSGVRTLISTGVHRENRCRKRLVARSVKAGHGALSEYDSKRLLSAYGVPVTRERLVYSAKDARAAAERLGYPVVLKGCAHDLLHKTEAGLVMVGLASGKEVGRLQYA